MTPPVVPPPVAREHVTEVDTAPLLKLVESHTPRPRRPWPTPMAFVRRIDQWFGQRRAGRAGRRTNVLRVAALAVPLVMLTLLTAGLWRWYQPGARAPQPAIAPFDGQKAKEHQDARARYLGVPVETTNSVGMKMVLIPPGEFQMGSSATEAERKGDEQQHRVRLTKPFFLGIHEVTQNGTSHDGSGSKQLQGASASSGNGELGRCRELLR